MKKIFNIYIAAFFALLLIFAGCSEQSNPLNNSTDNNNNQSNHYIVVLKTANSSAPQSLSSTRSEIQDMINSFNIHNSAVGHIYDNVIKGFSADLTPAQLAQIKLNNKVDFIEKDQLITINDQPSETVVLTSDKTIQSQSTPWGITRVGGPSTATTFGKAWIVDTGINLTHPDLHVYTSLCKTFVRYGRDATTPEDYNGHGSHLSGTIAAKNNGIGVIGVAPNAYVVAVKVLNSQGSGYISDIVAGLNYVYTNASNYDVVNCSFGGSQSTALDNAIAQFATRNDASGPFVYVTIAAGNSYSNANYFSPARVNGTGIFTESAFGTNDIFAYFSNWGNPPIDFSAPGINVLSTYKNGQYAYMSGTSMAAPHVAGIILARIAAGQSGTPVTNGHVTGDPDGNPDPIAHE